MLAASCPHLRPGGQGVVRGNGFESQEVAWEFQGMEGWGLLLGPGRGSFPGPAGGPWAASAVWPRSGGAGTLLFSSLGLHTCALIPSAGSMRDLSDPVPQGAPVSGTALEAREGEGYMDSAPAPGSAGELVLSR